MNAHMQALEERETTWAKLEPLYKQAAFELHAMALGVAVSTPQSIGPLYVRIAYRMQQKGLTLSPVHVKVH